MPSSIHDKALHKLLSELPALNTSLDSKEEKKSGAAPAKTTTTPSLTKTDLQAVLKKTKELVAAGADIHLLTSHWTVLQLAVACDDSTFIQQLMKRGVNTNLITSKAQRYIWRLNNVLYHLFNYW